MSYSPEGAPSPSWPAGTIMAPREFSLPSWPDTFLSPSSRGEPCLQLEQHVLLLISLSSGAFNRSLTFSKSRTRKPTENGARSKDSSVRGCMATTSADCLKCCGAFQLSTDIATRHARVGVFRAGRRLCVQFVKQLMYVQLSTQTHILFYDWTFHDAKVQKITSSLASIRVTTFTQRVVSITGFVMGRMSAENDMFNCSLHAFTRLQRPRLGTRSLHHIF